MCHVQTKLPALVLPAFLCRQAFKDAITTRTLQTAARHVLQCEAGFGMNDSGGQVQLHYVSYPTEEVCPQKLEILGRSTPMELSLILAFPLCDTPSGNHCPDFHGKSVF